MAFTGFPKDFFTFFEELNDNNTRDWFMDNKPRYETNIVAPCLDFIEAIAPPLAEISPHFLAIPKKMGGSMFRIYRDIRFSKDKTPYKTHAGLQFRHVLGKNAHAPGFYVHLSTDEILIGGGIWQPPSPVLANIRKRIDSHSDTWLAGQSTKGFIKSFGKMSAGNPLKRPPRGYNDDHPMIDDLKKRSFFMMADAKRADTYTPEFVTKVINVFADAAPMMAFLCTAVDAPF
ncbi:MAG: TIGR02453 family protein [Robiginitomaculum sp.]|nr:TIGR02453 family protein [Robiginitomaculum sp.]